MSIPLQIKEELPVSAVQAAEPLRDGMIMGSPKVCGAGILDLTVKLPDSAKALFNVSAVKPPPAVFSFPVREEFERTSAERGTGQPPLL